jgi:hypothetical protein
VSEREQAAPAARGAPFDTWPIDEHDPRFGYRWYCSPGVLVDCLTVRHGTVETVRVMHDSLDRLIARHSREIDRSGGLLIIGDWRNTKTYDPEARRLFLAELRKGRPVRGSVVILTSAGAFIRMAVQAARMASAVIGAPSIAVSDDAAAVLAEHGVTPPARKSVMPPPPRR